MFPPELDEMYKIEAYLMTQRFLDKNVKQHTWMFDCPIIRQGKGKVPHVGGIRFREAICRLIIFEMPLVDQRML